MATKKTNFTVYAQGTFDAGIDIAATSLEDAVEQAKKLTVTDFITFIDSHNDSSMEISGVFKS